MKKTIYIFFSCIIVLAIILVNVPTIVQANAAVHGDWSSGKSVTINTSDNPLPKYMSLLSTGVVITSPRRICYPFPKAQFGWSGSIYQIYEGHWYRYTTTVKWSPDTEGEIMACANVYATGTYALLGTFTGKSGVTN
jgi:hypothetical protein